MLGELDLDLDPPPRAHVPGGADGTLLQWDVSDGTITEARFAGNSIQLSSPFGPTDRTLPAIRSIDYSPDLGRILVGTNNCNIIELTETTNVSTLIRGECGRFSPICCCSHLPGTTLRTINGSNAIGG